MVESLLSASLHNFAAVGQGLTLLNSLGLAHAHPHHPAHGYIQDSTPAQALALVPTLPVSVDPTVALPSLFPVLLPSLFYRYFHFPGGHCSIAKQTSLWTRFCPLPEGLRLSLG